MVIRVSGLWYKYFNIVQKINEDNYEDVCKNYLFKYGYKTEDTSYYNGCVNDLGIESTTYAFITSDGILYNFALDEAEGSGSIMDINGPNKGPNALGRDIFIFYKNMFLIDCKL